jgi:serine/threonine protein kinase
MEKIPKSNYIYSKEDKIGSGSFSNVYKGINKSTKEEVAIKVENKLDGHNILDLEKNNSFLITQLLGYSLGQIKNKIDQNFDEYSVKNVGRKSFACLEYIHSKGIIHRDIKPDNIVLDKDYRKLYFIDFGLSKEYRRNGKHIPFRLKISPTGTLRYMSKYCNKMMEVSRRDDIISMVYVLIYLYKGTLPWQGIDGKTKSEKYKAVADMKAKLDIKEICEGCPEYLEKMLEYSYNLEFDQEPDYKFLINLCN